MGNQRKEKIELPIWGYPAKITELMSKQIKVEKDSIHIPMQGVCGVYLRMIAAI